MTEPAELIEFYPLAENRPDLVPTASGKTLDALTLDAVMAGEVSAEDITITPAALRLQAEIARSAQRDRLAENLERAAELAIVPQSVLLAAYEILRPGRAKAASDILAMADRLRRDFGAERIAVMLEEAASAYQRRGLFTHRY
jgi:propanediol dehydratase small subunit